MRGKLVGVGAVLFSITRVTGAQVTPAPIYLSDPVMANTQTTGNQRRASVAVGADGNYLIVWNGDAAQAGFYDIKGQLFSHEGVKIGGEFQVDQAGPNRIAYTPSIAADGTGSYIVAWADFNSTVTDSEIWMRRYDAAANPMADAIQVNTYTTERQRLPRVAADSTGQFVVVWESMGQDGSGLGVFGRQFDETGAPVGGEFAVNNTNTTGDQDRPAVDMDDQGFTVAFNDGNGGVAAREFGAFVAEGTSDFPVFGPNHQDADVGRLDGTANTFFVAENTTSSGIDGVRTENGVAQSPFPVASPGFNPRLSRPLEVGTPLKAPQGSLLRTVRAVWELESQIFCLGYALDLDGFLDEVGRAFKPLDSGTIADIGTGADQQSVIAAQDSSGPGSDVDHARGGAPQPDVIGIILDNNSNQILDPDESVVLRPGLTNLGAAGLFLTGSIVAPIGLSSPSAVTIDDDTADYGQLPPGGSGDCQGTGDCYGITVSGTRPGVHWDEAVVETLSTDVHKTWTLHVGESFADVPTTNLFYAFIENLLHNGITAGGACGGYCPTDGVKRQQMAVFLLKSRFGQSFVPPPATGTIFTDVTLANPFAAWIETLFLLGITGGCSGGPPPAPTQFCPDAIVNRQQMAVFLLKTFEGSAYIPPAATGIFQDLPAGNVFAPWAEELYDRQVTGGCVTVPLQYCPTNPTNRQQMAAFLVKMFGLLLYGP